MKIEIGKQYRTADGREVRIYAVDGLEGKRVHGAIFTPRVGWEHRAWFPDGRMHSTSSGCDLVEVKPRIKIKRWLAICETGDGLATPFFSSEENAKHYVDSYLHNAKALVEIDVDVEEGHGL